MYVMGSVSLEGTCLPRKKITTLQPQSCDLYQKFIHLHYIKLISYQLLNL